jgi:hypothetical protein
MGFATTPVENSNYKGSKQLWMYRCYNGTCYSQGAAGKVVSKAHPGDKVKFIFTKSKMSVEMFINDVSQGVVFSNIPPGVDLYPAVAFYGSNRAVEVISFSSKGLKKGESKSLARKYLKASAKKAVDAKGGTSATGKVDSQDLTLSTTGDIVPLFHSFHPASFKHFISLLQWGITTHKHATTPTMKNGDLGEGVTLSNLSSAAISVALRHLQYLLLGAEVAGKLTWVENDEDSAGTAALLWQVKDLVIQALALSSMPPALLATVNSCWKNLSNAIYFSPR